MNITGKPHSQLFHDITQMKTNASSDYAQRILFVNSEIDIDSKTESWENRGWSADMVLDCKKDFEEFYHEEMSFDDLEIGIFEQNERNEKITSFFSGWKAANRKCQKWEEEFCKVMPKDFTDWWNNSKHEWPMIARMTIESLRQREQLSHMINNTEYEN